MKWFDVDKQGLAQLLEKRGRGFAVCELVQNAWDQDVTEVSVTITRKTARTYTISVIDDDPNGWLDISHAFTLFAPSNKKNDPTKRGRFNLGEKLVLALCSEAEITTVSAAVRFDEKGRRSMRRRREKGSEFRGTLPMTADDVKEVERVLRTLLAPDGITTSVAIWTGDGLPTRFTIDKRPAARIATVTLPTVLEGEGGTLRRTRRKTDVELVEPVGDEKPHLYEMGIPVVELDGDDRWHINVQQKVPLNLDRDNVTPAYLREMRVAVINAAHDLLSREEATATWVTDATDDDRCDADAIEKVMDDRFGAKRVIYDPTDPEANKIAASKGYTVVAGGSLTGGQWANVRNSGAIKPSGQVTPSAKPYGDGEDVKVIPAAKWTADQKVMVDFARTLHSTLLGIEVNVRVVHTFSHFDACYATGHLDLNQRSLGHRWFSASNLETWIDLLIHEYGHHYSGDHLSAGYYRALTKLGARLAVEMAQDGSEIRKAIRQITRSAEKAVAL